MNETQQSRPRRRPDAAPPVPTGRRTPQAQRGESPSALARTGELSIFVLVVTPIALVGTGIVLTLLIALLTLFLG